MPHIKEGSFPFKMKTFKDDVEIRRLVAEAQKEARTAFEQRRKEGDNKLPE